MRLAMSVSMVLVLILSACTSPVRSAAQRFAQQVGRSADDADDIVAAFRRALQGASDDEITTAISRASNRTTWLDDVATAAARQNEELRTLRTVTESTCTIVSLADQLEDAGLDGLTGAEVEGIIAGHLRAEGLPDTEAKILEIWGGIDAQLRSLEQTGSIDWGTAWFDLGCFAASLQ